MKIIDYHTVFAQNDEALINEVKKRLLDGWQPLGGPAQIIAATPLGQQSTFLMQAMVKYGEHAEHALSSLLTN